MDEGSLISRAEKSIANSAGRERAVLVGSGTTALMIAMMLLPETRPRVIVPATVCVQVVYAVLYAGKVPVFADVRVSDSTIDPTHVKSLLESDAGIGAIIAVHLYGHPADMDSLESIAREYDVFLVEDAAQAQGGEHKDGRQFGSRGDASVLSFGYSKILDVGGGGVLLTDDRDTETRARDVGRSLSGAPNEPNLLARAYSESFYDAWNAYKEDRKQACRFFPLPDRYKSLFIHRGSEDQARRIADALPLLEVEVRRRRGLYAQYLERIEEIPGVTLFTVNGASASPWRFSFRIVQEKRDMAVSAIRSLGYHVSTWYPCVADWIAAIGEARPSLEVSRMLEKEIVNLWLTPDVDVAQMDRIAECLCETIGNSARTVPSKAS